MNNHESTLAYMDFRGLIFQAVNRHRRSHGGNLDEIESDANFAFMRACRTFDPSKGFRFSTWLWHQLRYGLIGTSQAAAKEGSRPHSDEDPDTVEAGEPGFDLGRLQFEVSEDAALILGLVASPPPDLRMDVRENDKRLTPLAWKKALTEYLKDIGWAGHRITESFAEIKEALQ